MKSASMGRFFFFLPGTIFIGPSFIHSSLQPSEVDVAVTPISQIRSRGFEGFSNLPKDTQSQTPSPDQKAPS